MNVSAGIPLRHKNTIAGRICAAVHRTEIDAGWLTAEPVAYKCALHDKGVPIEKLLNDASTDAGIMLERVRYGRFA